MLSCDLTEMGTNSCRHKRVIIELRQRPDLLLSLKTERIAGRIYRTRDEARTDVFDYIEILCRT